MAPLICTRIKIDLNEVYFFVYIEDAKTSLKERWQNVSLSGERGEKLQTMFAVGAILADCRNEAEGFLLAKGKNAKAD